MSWFSKNPFLAAVASLAAVLAIAGAVLVFWQAGRLSSEQAVFEDKKMMLERLQRNKPFPDRENVKLMEDEATQTAELLSEVAAGFAVSAPEVTPQAFQDELTKLVGEIRSAAEAKGVTLPEGFYLGFETYETQPPSAELAGRLALQLRSIHAVAKTMVDAQVKSLGPIVRAPLSGEGTTVAVEEEEDDGRKKGKKDKKDKPPKQDDAPEFSLAPFDVKLVADQLAFRVAVNSILSVSPPVFIRFVAVANSSPAAPLKNPPADAAEAPPEEQSGTIKPVFGRETVTADLRLATIDAPPAAR